MTLDNIPALVAALKAAKPGDTLVLAPGAYERLGLSSVKFAAPGVVIVGDGATVAGVELTGCEGIAVRGLEVTINARTQTAFNVVGCKGVHLDGLDIHGAPGGALPGLMFRTSSDVSATGCAFHDLGTGVRNIDSSAVTISGCTFRDLRGDGIQSSGSSGVTLTGNHFTDFHTKPGDHPDAIQFFTLNQKVSAQDIVITDNVVVRGSGDIVQGVFMGNEARLPYINVKISGNAFAGTMYRGISIGLGRNVEVTGNVVLGFPDMGSWITADDVDTLTLGENTSSDVVITNCTGVTNRGFSKAPASVQPENVAELKVWRDVLGSSSPVVTPETPDQPDGAPVDPSDLEVITKRLEASTARLEALSEGQAELTEAKATIQSQRQALEEIATMASAGAKLTSMAKAKPVFQQISAKIAAVD